MKAESGGSGRESPLEMSWPRSRRPLILAQTSSRAAYCTPATRLLSPQGCDVRFIAPLSLPEARLGERVCGEGLWGPRSNVSIPLVRDLPAEES